jgi:predicted metalloprotease with PDZ domain
MSVSADGQVKEVRWESTAFEAAITAGTKLVGVNGLAFTADELVRAIDKGKDGEPVRLLVQAGKHQREVRIKCPEGHRYPHLEPISGARLRLNEILAPKQGQTT